MARKRVSRMKRAGVQLKSGKANGPRLLTIKSGAEYLGLTTWGMRERIWAGQIPVVRFPGGRKMYLDVKDLDELVEKNKMLMG